MSDASGPAAQRPTYLALEPAGTAVFLHEPDPVPSRGHTAVLICPPFGWEEACSYRSMRAAAMVLARAGHPTARLMLPGTADARGGPRDGELLRQWIDAVGGAAGWLRDRTGASRCVIFGIGLGGLLGYVAACEQYPVDDLALWAVPDRGRALVRVAKSMSRLIATYFPEDHRHEGPPGSSTVLMGYLMTSETEAALSAVQLSALALPLPERRRVLLLSRGAHPVDARLRGAIEDQGAEVTVHSATDYDSLMVGPNKSQTPAATIAVLLDWLGRRPDAGYFSSTPARRSTRIRETAELSLGGTMVETGVSFPGSHGELFGILARDAAAGPAPLALLLLGAGALPHTGPNRAWVELSRRWASRGIPSVRLDLAGVGEAAAEDPRPVTQDSLHAPWRVDDLRGVLDQLQAAGIAERFVLGGLCSGAHTSLHTALRDPRVRGVLLINLLAVTWSSDLVERRRVRAAVAAVLPAGVSRRVDRELLAKAMHRLSPDRARRLLRRSGELRHRADAVSAFDQLRELETEALVLFGQLEPLYERFARQGLLDQLDRWPNLRLERIPSRDHMFRTPDLQRHVHERLDEAVARVLARHPARATSLQR